MNEIDDMRQWKNVRLGDVARTASGGTPKRTVPAYYGGGIPWVKSGELGDSTVYQTQETISKEGLETSSAKIFPKGTLCIALYGATVGKLAILGIDAATNQAVCGIFLPDCIDTRFAYRFLESRRRELVELGKGGAQSNISQEIIRDLEFPIPPIEEQREIVAEIEKQFTRLEAGVANLRRVQANLKRYRAAVLKAACEGKLVPTEAELARQEGRSYETGAKLLDRILTERRQKWNGKGKYKEPAKQDAATLPPVPEGWAWASVAHVLSQPLCNGISVKGSDNPPGIPALRLSAMSDNCFDYSDVRYLPLTESKVSDLWIKEGDFFVARGNGSLHLVGRGTPAQRSPRPVIFPDTMIRLRVMSSVQQTGWLRAIWPSRLVRSQIERKVKTTAGIYKIAQPEIEQIAIPLPPLAEQRRIVAEIDRRLSVVEELEAVVNANIQRVTRLRQSILQQAFEGKLVQAKSDGDGIAKFEVTINDSA